MQGVVAAMAGLALLALLQLLGREEPRAVSDAAAVASNFLLYRGAVAAYYHANPAAGPVIPMAALSLPMGYRPIVDWQNLRVAGAPVFVYGAAEPLVLGVVQQAQRSSGVSVGRVRGGRLISPAYGDLGVTVPASVPDGSVAGVIQPQ